MSRCLAFSIIVVLLAACAPAPAPAPVTSTLMVIPTLSVTVTPEGKILDEHGNPLSESTQTPEKNLEPESFTCWTENVKDGCLGLVERPGMEIAEKFYTAWFTGPSYQEYWKDVLRIDAAPSEREVRAWVEANGWHCTAPIKLNTKEALGYQVFV